MNYEYTFRADIREIPNDWELISTSIPAHSHCAECHGVTNPGVPQSISQWIEWYDKPDGSWAMVHNYTVCDVCGFDMADVFRLQWKYSTRKGMNGILP